MRTASGSKREPAGPFSRSTTRRAADDGIDVEVSGTFLSGNTANRNADLGIEAVPGVVDLGGNRASGNGNPLQCLNIVCR